MNKFHNTEVLMTRKKILNSCVYSESNIRILSSKWLVYPLNKFSRSPFKGSHIWATFCIFMIPEKTTKKRLMCCQEIDGSKDIGVTIIFFGSNHKNCANIFENNFLPCNISNVILSQYIYRITINSLRYIFSNASGYSLIPYIQCKDLLLIVVCLRK